MKVSINLECKKRNNRVLGPWRFTFLLPEILQTIYHGYLSRNVFWL